MPFNNQFIPFENFINVTQESGKIKIKDLNGKECFIELVYNTADKTLANPEINITKNRGSYYFTTDIGKSVDSMNYKLNCNDFKTDFINNELYLDNIKIDFNQAKTEQNISTTFDKINNVLEFKPIEGKVADLKFIDPIVSYNFTDQTGLSAYSCDDSNFNITNLTGTSIPPVCNVALTNWTSDAALDTSDNSKISDNFGSSKIAFFYSEFIINENIEEITKVNYTIEATTAGTNLDVLFYAYNYSSNLWHLFNSTYLTNTNDKNYSFSGNNNFINSTAKRLSFLFTENDSGTDILYVDFLKLEITYEPHVYSYLHYPINNTNSSNLNQVFTCNATATGSNLKNTTLYIYNSTNDVLFTNSTNITGVSNSTNLSYTFSLDGNYEWNCLAYNDLDQSNWTTNRTITIDTTKPSISIIYPINNTNSTNVNLNVNFTTSDLGTAIYSCWWTNNSGQTNNTITCGTNITTQTWSEGLNTITVYSNDSVNNINSTSVTFRIDNTPPILNIIHPEIGQSFSVSSIDLNYTISDSGIGTFSSCWYRNNTGENVTITCGENVTISQASDGTYTAYVWVNDTLGNLASDSHVWTISSNAPVVNLNYPENNKFFNSGENIYFNFTASDVNDLDTCELWGNWTGSWAKNYTWINPTNATMNFTKVNLTDGNYIWNVWCNDTTGLPGTSSWATLNRTLTIDTIYPQINLTYPFNTTYISIQTEINYSKSDLNINSCWYSLDSGATNSTPDTTCSNFSGLNSGQGSKTWIVYINDSANNLNSSSVTFFVDSINPSITLTTEFINGSFLNYNISIEINTSISDTNLNSCWYSDTQVSNISFTCGNNLSLNLSEGFHTIYVYANDTLNNLNSSKISFTTDLTYPILNITDISTTIGSQTLTFSSNTTDTNIGSCWYAVYNSTGGIDGLYNNLSVSCINTGTSVTVSAFGTYSLFVYSNDSAGNMNYTNESFTVSDSSATIIGGGGGSSPEDLRYPTIGLTRPNITIVYTELDMSIIFATLNKQCENKLKTLSFINYYEKCNLNLGELGEIRTKLMGYGVNIDEEEMMLWYQNYKSNKIFQTYSTKAEIEKYQLVMASLPNPLVISPSRLDKIFIASNPLKYTLRANKPISLCEVTSPNKDILFCDVTSNTTLEVRYSLNDTNFFSGVFSGQIAVTSVGKSTEQDVRYVDLTFRVYNLNYKATWTLGLPFWASLLFYVPVLTFGLYGGFIYIKKNKYLKRLNLKGKTSL